MCTIWSQTSFSRSRSWLTISSVWRKRCRCSVSQSIASRSRWFDGSSRIRRSGLLNSVPASATRMRQPPENSPQGRAWASLSKPRPCRIEAARAGAEAAPISSSRAWMSASRSPSWQASDSASSAVRSTSAASTASRTDMLPPGGSCGTEPMRFRPLRLMLPPSASICALDQAQESRLAGAVAADQADLPAVGHGRGGAIEQHAFAMAEGEVVDVEHGAAAFSTPKGPVQPACRAETPRL